MSRSLDDCPHRLPIAGHPHMADCALGRFGGRHLSEGVCVACMGLGENRIKGAGDVVAKALAFAGKLKPRGGGCGCGQRQQRLNEIMPFKKGT